MHRHHGAWPHAEEKWLACDTAQNYRQEDLDTRSGVCTEAEVPEREGATTTEAHRHSVAFRGGGLMVWWVVAYCGSPLKYSTVSASAGPNTALYASPNFGDA
jgi:hypothetical protein